MELLQLIVLALIQGITEFLPVSSSAHLILVPLLTEWRDQGLAIDVATHIGSLFAVVFYFRKDVTRILHAGLGSLAQRELNNPNARLFWYLVYASVPVLLAGFVLRDVVSVYLRDPLIIAGASIGFGLLLLYADMTGKRSRQIDTMTVRDVIMIGLAQVLALIPGTSRAGITITAGLFLGLDRDSAARFSFLMAIPVILAAGGYELLKLVQSGAALDLVDFFLTALLSAISAFITIHYFLKFLSKVGLLPFVIYRVVLGIILIFLFV